MTTVTISDELRKKLKRLAAKYDTSQAEIIAMALETLEKFEAGAFESRQKGGREKQLPPVDANRQLQIKHMLAEARKDFERDYPDLAQSHRRLRQNLHLLDEATIGHWDLPFEEE